MPIKNRVGEKRKNSQGLNMEIVEYIWSNNLTVLFDDGTKRYNVAYKEFNNGSVKNPMFKDIFGVACFGIGKYTARVNGKMSKCYGHWFNMIIRCYDVTSTRASTYHGKVTVCEEWLNYQDFAEWYYSNYDESYMSDWHLDKDILSPGNCLYSPKNCCMIPKELNAIFKDNNRSKYGYLRGTHKKDNKFQASISIDGRQRYIGLYSTEEAHEEYILSKKSYLEDLSDRWRGILDDKICDAIRDYDIDFLL